MCQEKTQTRTQKKQNSIFQITRIITIYMHIYVLLRMSFAIADFSPKCVCSRCGGLTLTNSQLQSSCSFLPSAPPDLSRMQQRKQYEKAQRDCSPVMVVGKTDSSWGKELITPQKIQVERNKEVGVKIPPFLLPFLVSPLYFQLLCTQVCCLAEEKVGLWSVHNCSSLLLLFIPIFPLLYYGI